MTDSSISYKHISIFDTTLRDGQQSPGAGMSLEDNMRYARLAKKLNVDCLEVGFPSASQSEFERTQQIIYDIVDETSPVIVALTQLRPALIEKTIQALLPAVPYHKGRMHLYLPIDPDLALVSIGTDYPKDFVSLIYDACKQATDAGLSVEFSLEGFSRIGKNFDLGLECWRAAIEGGASVLNCPDTIGLGHPSQGPDYVVSLMNRQAKIITSEYPTTPLIWSTHNHNDLGTAVENSWNAITQGPARQVECTINGVGERAGNASLEQIALQLELYGHHVGLSHQLNLSVLQEISDLISKAMLPRQAHRPITGDNAARHTSGGHVNALLKNPSVYQPFDPKIVGKSGISLVFGPSSGGNHVRQILQDAGYRCSKEESPKIAQYLKDLFVDRYKGVSDEEVIAGYKTYYYPITITAYHYSKKSDGTASFSYTGTCFGQSNETITTSTNDSALAIFHTILDKAMPGRQVINYESKADSQSIHAMSICNLSIGNGLRSYTGQSKNNDIEVSALQALAHAYNIAYIEENFSLSLS